MDDTPNDIVTIRSNSAAIVSSVEVAAGKIVSADALLLTTELMKMRQEIRAEQAGRVLAIHVSEGDAIEEGAMLIELQPVAAEETDGAQSTATKSADIRADLQQTRIANDATLDEARADAVAKRHATGMRTARENIDDLVDEDSFIEYGGLATAAQRRKFSDEELTAKSPADGIVTGIGTINAGMFGKEGSSCAILAVDYTVMAGTQGYFHHKKIDRLLDVVHENPIPTIIFAEGGGGRPNDVDAFDISFSGLDVPSFYRFAQLSGKAPLIAVVAGRCFAGNAAFPAVADVIIATKNANLGMGGPAMIEGGGLGTYTPEEIGPSDVQSANGVIDILVEDEADATAAAKTYLGYFQGSLKDWKAPEPDTCRRIVPEDRQLAYDMRKAIAAIADSDSILELRSGFGTGMITALVRVEGRPCGLVANNPMHLGGAIDPEAADKAARFLQLCDAHGLPVISLCDTPGFMVGPDIETRAQVRHIGRLFLAGAQLSVPLFTIVLRKGYGLGAQAMAGGSFHRPSFTVSWPSGEVGAMGLEGAVRLGARKELEAIADHEERETLFKKLVAKAYEKGRAINAARKVEFDAVIDPAETRKWLVAGLNAAGQVKPSGGRRFVDAW
ncbi:MAG: carboxyl transferase domain-containing protein [Rhizobiaceae bacterium]